MGRKSNQAGARATPGGPTCIRDMKSSIVDSETFLSLLDAYVAEPCSPLPVILSDVARRVAQVRQAAFRRYRESGESSRHRPPMFFG